MFLHTHWMDLDFCAWFILHSLTSIQHVQFVPRRIFPKKMVAYVDVAAASYSFVFGPFRVKLHLLIMNIEAISKSDSDSTLLSERSDHCENERAGSSKRTSGIIVRI